MRGLKIEKNTCIVTTLMTHLGTKIFRYQVSVEKKKKKKYCKQIILFFFRCRVATSCFLRIIADVIFSINHQVSVNLKRNITCSMCIIVEVFQTQMQQSQLPFQIIIRMSPWKSQSTSPLLTYASSLTYLALVHHLSNSKDVVLIFYSSAFGSFFNCRSQQFS